KPPGQALSRVVAGNEERRSAAFVVHGERGRFVLRQKPDQGLAQLRLSSFRVHGIANCWRSPRSQRRFALVPHVGGAPLRLARKCAAYILDNVAAMLVPTQKLRTP